MKNDLIWTKTLLTVYRYLERICGGIDKIIMQSALQSSDIIGQSYFYNNTFSISQRLIDLSERKITLINLKILIEETLKEVSINDAKILIEKYHNNKKCKDIAEKYNLSMRTFFRKITNAEKSFNTRLHLKGYTDIRFKYMLKSENWINNVYAQFASHTDRDFVFTNVSLKKAVAM